MGDMNQLQAKLRGARLVAPQPLIVTEPHADPVELTLSAPRLRPCGGRVPRFSREDSGLGAAAPRGSPRNLLTRWSRDPQR
jgi:hypothetical protein